MTKVKARKDKVMLGDRAGRRGVAEGMDGCTLIRGHARFEIRTPSASATTVCRPSEIFINVGGRAVVPDCRAVATSTT